MSNGPRVYAVLLVFWSWICFVPPPVSTRVLHRVHPLILPTSVTTLPMLSHPHRLSPPRRASSSSSAAHHHQSMAYPFPRFSSAPQTPQYLKGVESPSSWQSRGLDKSRSHTTRWLITSVIAAVICLVVLAKSFASHPRQTDRIPFTDSDIAE